jgi:hypothetical protein
MSELRLLSAGAASTRFDFVWTVDGLRLPLLGITEAEPVLRHALMSALDDHGVLSWARCGGRG